MAHAISALEEIDMLSLDKQGKPPKPSRLSSASAARALFQELIRQDEYSAIVRVRTEAMKNGEPPYNQAMLNATGQGSRANANFLMGQDLITKANNGYNDLITASKQLMTIEVEGGEPAERMSYSRVIAEELTRTIRKWPSFMKKFLRLVDAFVTQGVSVEYSPDDKDFRFDVATLGEFMVPRQTEADEEKTAYAFARKDLLLTELYDHIENEAVAAKLGWNVPAVKAAIGRATTKTSNGEVGEVERLQQQIKNNDLEVARKFAHVQVLHAWVREFDGSISFFILEKDAPEGEFLFVQHSRYDEATEAFNYYCYGIGNGTLHSIRGLGHMIFALVQLHNRLMCQKADGTMLAESIMVQSATGTALQEASINYLGPMSMLSPGLEVIERQFQGGSDRTLGFLGEVKTQMGQVSSRFMTPTAQSRQGAYKSTDEVAAELEQLSSSDSGAIDLFLCSWDRTIRKMCERIVKGSKRDPLVAEFHRRVDKKGITQDILDSIDHDSTYAFRAIGSGSPAARSLAFTKLMRLLPQLDEIGRKNLIYEFVANEVGQQHADVFASRAEEPRFNSEASIAMLENELLMLGRPIPVLTYQMHATHVQIHIPPILDVLDGVETGEIDPMQVLDGMQASLNHIAGHGEALAQDPTQAPLYKQVKEAVNNLQQVVTNMDRKLKAEQRKGAEAGGGEGGEGTDTQAAIEMTKLRMMEFKADLAERKGELELAIMQAKADQNLALNDLKGMDTVTKKMMYPRSDYSERR